MTKRIPGRLVIPSAAEAGTTGFSQDQVDKFHTRRLERLTLPDDEVAMQRLKDVFEIATHEELQQGLAWYDVANNFCAALVEEFPKVSSVAHAAGIVASLSPSRSWDGNRVIARQFLNGERIRCLGWSRRDAEDILAGKSPDVVLFKGGMNFKIQSFFTNMVHRDSLAVTIDRHGLATLFNDREFMGVKHRVDRRLYVWSERMFQSAASEYGLLPADFQAVTWVVWRKNDRARRLSEMKLPLEGVLKFD